MALGGLALAAIGTEQAPEDIEAATSDTDRLPDFDESFDEADGGVEAFATDDEHESDAREVDDKAESDVIEKDEPESDEPEEDEAESDEKDHESDHEGAIEPPKFEILWPHDGAVVDDEKIAFEGVTTPGARVFAGPWEADVNDDGGWRIVLYLEPGVNKATLYAESDGGVSEDSVTVTRVVADEPKDDPKDDPKEEPTYELVAYQQYGYCEEPEPCDVFWGETAPGATVIIWSEYGSKEVIAGPEGGWKTVVYFPEAPYGVEFQVKVKSIEQTRYFAFTSYGNPPEGDS